MPTSLILHFKDIRCINDKIAPSANLSNIIDELMKRINMQSSIIIIR